MIDVIIDDLFGSAALSGCAACNAKFISLTDFTMQNTRTYDEPTDIQNGMDSMGGTGGGANAYKGIAVFMPTRNRAEIVTQSIRLVLDNPLPEMRLLVSDNSTDEQAARTVEEFCRALDDPRLHYVRTPRPLSMSENLDWSIEQAMERFDCSHFTCLWDRMVIKPGGLETLRDIARQYPGKACAFHWDVVHDADPPCYLAQHVWTGRLMEVKAKHLLWLASQSREQFTPKMTNCIIPRAVLQAVRARYGDYCNSITADICFGYRCLSLVDSVLFYDRALYVQYGENRSNAKSQERGIHNQDTKDFLANLQKQQTALNWAAPIPEATVVGNQTLHEYCVLQKENGTDLFPDVNMPAYLDMLARDTSFLQGEEAKRAMTEILARHGKSVPDAPAYRPGHLEAVKHAFRSAPTKPFWLALARSRGVGLPGGHVFLFPTSQEALDCALHYARRKSPTTYHIDDLLGYPDMTQTLPWNEAARNDTARKAAA